MRRLFWLLLVLSCGVSTASAQAQSSQRGSPEYRELIRKALEEYGLGNYPEAKLFFSDAHALFPNARTLRGLALTAYALRDYVEAAQYFEQALANPIQPLSPELRSGASEFLAQARRFVAQVTLNLEPATADVRIDERPLVRGADGSVLLNPGQHELVASAPDYETVTRRWSVEAGSRTQLDVSLPMRGAATASAPTPTPPTAAVTVAPVEPAVTPAPVEPDVPPSETGSSRSVAPWIVVGVSGAVAVAGGVLLGMTAADIGSVENARRGTEWTDVKPAYERTPGVSVAGFTMLGLGLAGVAAGLAWQFWPEEKEGELAVGVTPTGASIRGAF